MKATMRIIGSVIEAIVIIACFVVFLYCSIDLLTEWDWLNDVLNSADDILTFDSPFGNVYMGLGGMIGFALASTMSSLLIFLIRYLGWQIGGALRVIARHLDEMLQR